MIVGAAIGLALTVPTTRAIGGLLFGIQPMDAASVLAATAVLVVIALLATYLPARRAAGLDPVAILRSE
jgi:ABC-type antimicrobial peptide transport system permease subunit